jgi:hypothetical protein
VAAIAGGHGGRRRDRHARRRSAEPAPGGVRRSWNSQPRRSGRRRSARSGAAGGETTGAAGEPAAGRGSGRRALDDPRDAAGGAAKGAGKAGGAGEEAVERAAGKVKKDAKDAKDAVPGECGPVRRTGEVGTRPCRVGRGKDKKRARASPFPT